MTFNYSPGSSLYHGINPGDTNEEKNALDDLLAGSSNTDGDVVEGRITQASPVNTFEYKNKTKGLVQNFTLTDVLAKQSKHDIYTYRVTAWNDQVANGALKIGQYVKLSKFVWKHTTYPGQLPDHHSRYEVHLKKTSVIEGIPV